MNVAIDRSLAGMKRVPTETVRAWLPVEML